MGGFKPPALCLLAFLGALAVKKLRGAEASPAS
jgi:hypothetical protein